MTQSTAEPTESTGYAGQDGRGSESRSGRYATRYATEALGIYAYLVYTLAFALGTGRGVTDSLNGRGAVGLDASAFASPVASVSAGVGGRRRAGMDLLYMDIKPREGKL